MGNFYYENYSSHECHIVLLFSYNESLVIAIKPKYFAYFPINYLMKLHAFKEMGLILFPSHKIRMLSMLVLVMEILNEMTPSGMVSIQVS